ncbi:hypothetical protein ACX0G9_15805 [Flavitalea flava]
MNKKKNVMTVVVVMACAAVLMLVISFLIRDPAAMVLRYLALAELIGLAITLFLYYNKGDWFKERPSREDYD